MTTTAFTNSNSNSKKENKRTKHSCPDCNQGLRRIHRTDFDRFLSKFVLVHRYRCSGCKWSGLRRPSH